MPSIPIWNGTKAEVLSAINTHSANTLVDGSSPLALAALRSFPDSEVIVRLLTCDADPWAILPDGRTLICAILNSKHVDEDVKARLNVIKAKRAMDIALGVAVFPKTECIGL